MAYGFLGDGATTVIVIVSKSTNCTFVLLSMALNTTVYFDLRTCEQSVFQLKTPLLIPIAGVELNVAGLFVVTNGPPEAVKVINSLLGSPTLTVKFNAVPASTQVSFTVAIMGGWFTGG